MCGIIYVKRKDNKPAYKSVLKRYRKQSHRGTQGYGYVAVKDDQVVSYKRAETEAEIVKMIEKETAPEILFHHRYPTSTPNVAEAAHPILVHNPEILGKDSYFVVHNGVITNDDELYEKHIKMGFEYTTELEMGFKTKSGHAYHTDSKWNDSEALAIETALALSGKKPEIDSIGAAAVIGFKIVGSKIQSRFFYHNYRNPLVIDNGDVMVAITSEGRGVAVPQLYVNLLSKDGSFIDHPAKILVPLAHKPTVTTGMPRPYEDDSWDNAGYRRTGYTPAGLPAAPPSSTTQGRMGFDRLLTSEERAAREQTDAEAMDFDEEDYGIGQPKFMSEGEMKKVSEILSFRNSLAYFGDDKIWEEYQEVSEACEKLEEHIAGFDAFVNDSDTMDDKVADHRVKLDTSLAKLKSYLESIEREITRRESLNRHIESRVQEQLSGPRTGEQDAMTEAIKHATKVIGF